MMPGAGQMAGAAQEAVDSGQMTRIEAIIDSMTPEERRRPELIKASRRRRIALGSGTSTAEVNRLLQAVRRDAEDDEDGLAAARCRGWRRPRRAARSLSGCIDSSSPSSPCIGLVASCGRRRLPPPLRRRATDRAAALAPADHRRLRQRLPAAVDRPADEPLRAHRPACRDSPTRPRSTRRSTRSSRTCWRPPASTTATDVKPWLGDQIAARRLADRCRRRRRPPP